MVTEVVQQTPVLHSEMLYQACCALQFDKERQDARERIVKMTQEHERQLLMRMSELGLIGQEGTGQHMVFA